MTRSVRVLLLIKGLGPGGAEQLLVNQAGARDREAFEYEAAYLVPYKDHLVPVLADLHVTSSCLDSTREWDPRWALRLRRRLLQHPVDVIHGHSPYVAAVTRIVVRTLPRTSRPALVYTEHNRWPRHQPLTRLANRATFGLDDVQIAVSDDVRATMPRRRRGRVQVVVHGVDVQARRTPSSGGRGKDATARASIRTSIRDELGIGPDEVVIGTVANLRREKAYDVLLTAASRTFELDNDDNDDDQDTRSGDRDGGVRNRPPIRFVAVGQGPLLDEMRALHSTLGLGDRFLFLGYRPDAVDVMQAFDLFTLTSRHEGLPVSLMDALVAGIPVVATAVGGIPEMVTDDIEGRLVASDDVEALAQTYATVARDGDLRQRYAQAAAARGDTFDIEPATRTIEAAYRFAVDLNEARRRGAARRSRG